MNDSPVLRQSSLRPRVPPITGGTRQAVVASSPSSFDSSVTEKFLSALLVLLVGTDLQYIAAVTPQLANGLNTTLTAVSYSLAMYAAAAVVAAALLRFSRQHINQRMSLPLAAGVYSIACGLTAGSTGITVFLAGRALAGLAGGLISALAITALAQGASYHKRGAQMTLISVGYYLAPLAGVPLGVWLMTRHGWRMVFVITGLFTGVAAIWLRRVSRVQQSEMISHSPPMIHNGHSASAWLGVVNAFFVSGGLVGLTAYIGTWLFDSLRAKPEDVSVVYALINAGALAGGILGGWLADRCGKRKVVQHATAAMLMGLLLLASSARFVTEAEILLVIITLVIFAAALRVAPLQALLTELVAPTRRASYIALRNLASQLGIGLGVLACGRLYQSHGFAGVSALCATFTAGAWLTIVAIREPEVR